MTSYRIVKTLFYSALILLILNSIIAAQCEGVYFDAFKARIFPEKVFFNATADLNGDGKADLIGYDLESSEKIYILPQVGQGDFSSPLQEISAPNGVRTPVIIADFNTDGKNDLIVRLLSDPLSVLVYINDGDANFTPLTPYQIIDNEGIINVIDISNDGIADLFTVKANANDTGRIYSYRLGNADGTFGNQIQLPLGGDYLAPADYNNDGRIDFVHTYVNFGVFFEIQYNQGNGVFVPGARYSITSGDDQFLILMVKDFDNDGNVDWLGTNYYLDRFSIIKNPGNNEFSRTDFPLSHVPFSVEGLPQVGDFNGDGFLDVITYAHHAPYYSIHTNDGTGNFTTRNYNQRAMGIPFADIDGDNKTDFISGTVGSTNGFTSQDIPINQSRLFNEKQLLVAKNVCNQQGQTKTIDFNRDGATDLAFWRPNDGRWLNRRTPYYSSPSLFFFGLSGDIPTPGDYDGDGKTDFAVFRPSDGFWYIQKSSDQTYLSIPFGLSTDKPVASDYDGDGKTDLAVYRPSDGNWYVLNSATQDVFIAHFGISEDKPLPEDYDGDGRSDLAVFRPSTGVWYYLKSSDGNFAAIKWGIGTDKPVPADYDGDLKADLAVFRESEGNWYILKSSDSQYGIFRFGLEGDIPQPGDWDANGITDLGVYRPNTTTWWFVFNIYSKYTFGSTDEIPVSYILKSE